MSEFIEFLSDDALNSLDKANAKLVEMLKNIDSIGKGMKNITTPSGSDTSTKKLTTELEKQASEIENLQKKLASLKTTHAYVVSGYKAEIATMNQLNTTLNKNTQAKSTANQELIKEKILLAEVQKELKNQALAGGLLGNAYVELEAKMNLATRAFQDLKTKQVQGQALNAKEIAQLTMLEKEMTDYQSTLKQVDMAMGVHRRNVGDYAIANRNLQMSVAQISRELPNFGQSFQIGVLSLTNNVGQLIDGIKQAKEHNAQLRADNKASIPVVNQLASAFFNWQTALFLGIGVLSAYSGEIGNWVKSLWEGDDALQSLRKSTLGLRMAQGQASAETQKQMQLLAQDIAILKDARIPLEARKSALERLKSATGLYLKDMTVESALLGVNKTKLDEINKAIMAKSKLESRTQSLDNDRKRVELMEQEVKYREEIRKELDASSKIEMKYSASLKENVPTLVIMDKKRYEAAQNLKKEHKEFLKQSGEEELLKQSTASLNNQILNTTKKITEADNKNEQLAKDSAILRANEKDSREETNKILKEKIELLKLADDYESKQTKLSGEAEKFNDIANNERKSYEDRLNAKEQYISIKDTMLQNEYDHEIRLANERYAEEKRQLDQKKADDKNALAAKRMTLDVFNEHQKYYNAQQEQNEKQLAYDLLEIKYDYQNKVEEFSRENRDYYLNIELDQKEKLTEISKAVYESRKIYFEKDMNDTRLSIATREKAFQEYKKHALAQIELDRALELANVGADPLKIQLINQKYDNLKQTLEQTISPAQRLRMEFEDMFRGLGKDVFAGAGLDKTFDLFFKLDSKGKSVFANQLDAFEKSEDKWKVYANGIATVMSEAYGIIDSLSAENFEAEKSRLEEQYQTALKYAGDDKEAKEKLDKDYQKQKKKLARREAQHKQKEALFGVAIDTAKGVVAAANPKDSWMIPFIIALGAIQAGVIASQKIPEYWKGTDNANEGLAYTQEKGQEIITDKYGHIKDLGDNKGARLTWMSKGDKVYTAEKTKQLLFNNELNNLLTNNGISYNQNVSVSGGITKDEMYGVMNDVLGKRSSQHISFDRNGFSSYISKNGNITKSAEQRGSGKGNII